MPQNTHRLLTLLDVDNTLVSSTNELNAALVRDLKAAGTKDICLFTSMGAKTLLNEDTGGMAKPSLTRYELVKKLEQEGFKVHAVITPIDPFYRKKPKSLLSEDSKQEDNQTRYDLVLMSSPLEKDLSNLPLIKSNAAYVRSENRLFYVNKANKECIEVHLDSTKLETFDSEMKPASTPVTLTKEQLEKIASITGPIRPAVGLAYEELLKPQYMRRHNELKEMELDEFALDPEYTQMRQRWEYYALRESLINGLIKCRNPGDYAALIQFLEGSVKDAILLLEKSLSATGESKKDSDEDTLVLFREMEKHISAIKGLGESSKELKEEDQKHKGSHTIVIPPKAMEYILGISWVKESAWIEELLKQGHRSPWDKGSMYACVANDPFFAKFDGFLFFDDKDACLKTVSDLHAALPVKKPLYSVLVNPQFQDPDGYYKDNLNESGIVKAIIDEINHEIVNLLKRKNVKEPTSLFKEDQARYEALQALEVQVREITNQINTHKDNNWKKAYKTKLKTAISTSLSSGKLDKYDCLDKVGKTILNLLTGLTVVTPFIKYYITGSWFFSREGKSREAVLKMQDLAEEIKEEKAPAKKSRQ